MLISLEAVPRNREVLVSFVKAAAAHPQIGFINVPDMLRFSLRSWDACGILREAEKESGRSFGFIPHLRAMDFNLNRHFPLTGYFKAMGINEVLVIAGDPPEMSKMPLHETYSTGTAAFIKKLKTEMPELKVYAAFDSYRSNIRYELDYLKAKEDAGADGFFSQPFFDLRLLEIYAEYLEGKNVFWGISPVFSGANRNYWESRNRAIFPKSFRPDLFWNVDFGRRVLDYCETHGFNLYFMPIKIDLKAYLAGIFGYDVDV
jgi:methylenetetrahydrofolate reductase (NADPH)